MSEPEYPDIRGPFPETLFVLEYLHGKGTDLERFVKEYRNAEGHVLFRVDPISDMPEEEEEDTEVEADQEAETLPDFSQEGE